MATAPWRLKVVSRRLPFSPPASAFVWRSSPAAPREEPSTSLVVEAPQTEVVKQVVEVISAQCDPLLMADMVRSTIAALRRYQEGAAQVSSAEALPLYEAISDLIATGDVSLVSMVVKGCAVALGRIPSSAAIPAKDDAALQKTLAEFSDAIRVLYPTGPRAPHAAHR